jgi:predicted NodU family carbamoyl transferase
MLINTSFDIHGEPINFSLEDSIRALELGAVDFLIYKEGIISANN